MSLSTRLILRIVILAALLLAVQQHEMQDLLLHELRTPKDEIFHRKPFLSWNHANGNEPKYENIDHQTKKLARVKPKGRLFFILPRIRIFLQAAT